RLARASLQYLAQRQLPPTPEQYLRAWHCVGGTRAPKDDASEAAHPPVAMAALIAELVGLLDTSHHNWTRARKIESLKRVLANNPTNLSRMSERLTSLFALWKSEPADRREKPAQSGAGPVEHR